jgi:hypothetical protein
MIWAKLSGSVLRRLEKALDVKERAETLDGVTFVPKKS